MKIVVLYIPNIFFVLAKFILLRKFIMSNLKIIYSIFFVFALNFTFIIRYFSFERTTKLFFMQPLSDRKILFLALKVETVLRGYNVKK